MDNQQTPARSIARAAAAPATTTLAPRGGLRNPALVGRAPSTGEKRVPPVRLGASLLFAPGDRSGPQQVRALAAAEPSFAISFDPREDAAPRASTPAERWLEVLANGLTFDLEGLAPGTPQPVPPGAHRYGLPPDFNGCALEAISLRPGPQLASGGPMLPVVRGLARLAAALAALPGVLAVGWHAARTLSAPDHFRGSVLRWIGGGAFPGLGLTALTLSPEAALQSEGLALFTGQELRLAPELARDRAAGARLALRLFHWLVEHGRLDAPVRLSGSAGEPLVLEPSANKRLVGVTRG